ncbi:MAG: c-type cytochrome biogenesis protein CcsB [Actinomycetota bacterium]|nr:c-type cytochrome biogenesis protein CcsB [Actinomycetota bacterium]MDQ3899714.1 c-type cytochrome biogenesis protein CcsB [Actinomycetota bacterium]
MPISPVLASYSDLAYGTALVLYVLAMALHSVEYAAGRVPVTASAEAMANGSVATLAGPGSMPARGRAERIGRSAVALTGLAMLVHASSLALRGAAIGRVPWANMYEFISAICFVAVAGWLVVLYRQRGAAASLHRLGGFVLLPVVVLMFLGGTVLYARAEPLIPALNSYWITIHVSAAITATGILLVSGVASVLYLAGAPAGSWIGARLPDSATLDRLAYRTAVVALPIWTFAVITGAIWAEAAWGRYWGWDPKETCALVAWVVYAGYLHARATAGWRGRGAAWINVAGFGVMLFNLFFVNIVIAGFHSYAGV